MRRPRLPDPAALARFYQALLGGEINRPDRWTLDADWMTLHPPGGPVLAFQRAADHRPPRWPDPDHPQQLHLDLGVSGGRGVPFATRKERVLAEVARLESAGATRSCLADAEDSGSFSVLMRDPEGNEFCVH